MAGCSSGDAKNGATQGADSGGTTTPTLSGPGDTKPTVPTTDDTKGTAGSPGTTGPATNTGAGGTGAAMGTSGAGAVDPKDIPDLRGTGVCADLHTNYAGDHACLPPPAAGEGMQIHVGPSSCTDPSVLAQWVVKPGEENSKCFNYHTPNGEPIFYQTYVLSGRDGTHHIFNTMYKTTVKDGIFEACRDGGTGTLNHPLILAPAQSSRRAGFERGICGRARSSRSDGEAAGRAHRA